MTVAPPSRVGRQGEYVLGERLGEGGMGVVHLATLPTGQQVAVKLLRAHVVGDEEARSRLAREVASLRRIRSRWVAEVVDADPWAPWPYLVTRYVPGPTVHDHVHSVGVIAPDDLLWFAGALAEGVASVHDAGVLHRDIKPSNVILDGRTPILIDFGLARVAEDPRLTRTGWLLGTPGYLAPEVLHGEPATAASDVHSWAATVAFAALGRAPFGSGPAMAILDRTRRGEHDLRPLGGAGAPAAVRTLREVLEACLDPDPLRRPTLAEILAWTRPQTTAPGPLLAAPPRPAPASLGSAGDPFADSLALVHGAPGASSDPGADPGSDRDLTAVLDAVGPSVAPGPVHRSVTVSDAGLRDGAGGGVPADATRVAPVPLPAAVHPTVVVPPGASVGPAASVPVAHPPVPAGPVPVARPGVPPRPPTPVPAPEPAARWSDDVPPHLIAPAHPVAPPLEAAVAEPVGLRVRRSLLIGLLGLAGVAATALAPFAWALAGAVLLWALVAAGVGADAVTRRRALRGARWHDGPGLVLGAPWHLLRALPVAAVLVVGAGIAGTLAGGVAVVLLDPVAGSRADAGRVLAIAGAVAVLVAWWGPGGGALRRPVRVLATPVSRGVGVWIGVVVLLLAAVALGADRVGDEGSSWRPLTQAPPPLR